MQLLIRQQFAENLCPGFSETCILRAEYSFIPYAFFHLCMYSQSIAERGGGTIGSFGAIWWDTSILRHLHHEVVSITCPAEWRAPCGGMVCCCFVCVYHCDEHLIVILTEMFDC